MADGGGGGRGGGPTTLSLCIPAPWVLKLTLKKNHKANEFSLGQLGPHKTHRCWKPLGFHIHSGFILHVFPYRSGNTPQYFRTKLSL